MSGFESCFILKSNKNKNIKIKIDGLNSYAEIKFHRELKEDITNMILNNKKTINDVLIAISYPQIPNLIKEIKYGKFFNNIKILFNHGFFDYEYYAAIFYYLIELEIEKNELFLADLMITGDKKKFLIQKIIHEKNRDFLFVIGR